MFCATPAHDERERGVDSERVVPRDALVGAAVRHRHLAHEVRRLRVRGRRAAVLPRGGRVPHHTQLLDQGGRPEVSPTSLVTTLCKDEFVGVGRGGQK